MAIKETVPFNFDEVYSYIENKFQEKGYDTQEGSNTMQLVTAMSYLTSMLNVNTAVNINETLLPQARKRNMILQDARSLGYEIEHRQSYKYQLSLNFTDAGTYTINRYEAFSSGDKKYYYLGSDITDVTISQTDAETEKFYVPNITRTVAYDLGGDWDETLNWAIFSQDTPVDENGFIQKLNNIGQIVSTEYKLKSYFGKIEKIDVVEGILHTHEENPETLKKIITADDEKKYFDIPFTNVEENGIDLFLTYLDPDGTFHNNELWSKANSFILDNDSVLLKQYVRLDNIDFGTPRIYFKFGDIGKELVENTLIKVNLLESSGIEGKALAPITPDALSCAVLETKLLIEGAEEETDESIKNNAPLFYNTANRIITKSDYEAFANRQAAVKTSVIWDGNEEFPKRPGNIWFSFLPSNNERALVPQDENNASYLMQGLNNKNNWYLEDEKTSDSDNEVAKVFSDLDKFKIPTLKFHHRQPIYMDYEYNIEIIKYVASVAKKVQHQNIFQIVDTYFSEMEGIENFGFEYLNSNLIRRIDKEITDTTGLNITLDTSVTLNELNIISEEFDPNASPVDIGKRAPFKEEQKIFSTNESVGFGVSLKQSGNLLVVGTVGNSEYNGSFTVYDYDSGVHTVRGTFEEADTLPNDMFGRAIALSGNRVIVGAPLHDTELNDNAGKVYIYDISGNTLTPRNHLTVEGSSQFGNSLALDDGANRLLVGEQLGNVNGTQSGKVHIYEWNGSDYIKIDEIVSENVSEREMFGSGVAAHNGTILIGAQGNSEGSYQSGKVYVYKWNGTEYVYQSSLTASDQQSNDLYGHSVDIYENKIVVGAPKENTAAVNAGKIYFYEYKNGLWLENGTLTASDAEQNGSFGIDVSLFNGSLLVGATIQNEDTETSAFGEGKFYVFENTSFTVGEEQIPSDANTITVYAEAQTISKAGNFGNVIETNGNGTIIVENPDDGKFYLYQWNGDIYIELQQITV